MLRFQIEFATSRLVAERGYYPYGLPFGQHQDWTATDRNAIAPGLPGFTGQEGGDIESWEGMFQNFGARYYDSQIGRWHAPDPAWVGFSPYEYCHGNPAGMVDPDGREPITAAIIIGAALGAYTGGTMANGSYNPTKWDFGSGRTWGYMLGGAVVGGISGGVGAKIAASGMPMATTTSIVTSSYIYSTGTALYTDNRTDVSVSFGAGSYNFNQNEFGYLGKEGNSTMENIGYGVGAFSNLVDVFGVINKPDATYDLGTDNTEINKNGFDPGHSSFSKDGDKVISFGPNSHEGGRLKSTLGTKSTNNYKIDVVQRPNLKVALNSRSTAALAKVLPKVPYSAATGLQCAGATSVAGLLSGHYMANLGLLMFNAPQIVYWTYKYEQLIRMAAIMTTVHTTR